jgi:sigma-B regulation protein RsbU (phosphoserine phosphatase)
VGAVEGLDYAADEVTVAPGSRLYIYSDGAFEISRVDGTMWPFREFEETLARAAGVTPHSGESGVMDSLLGHIKSVSGRDDFQDDFSMVEVAFA